MRAAATVREAAHREYARARPTCAPAAPRRAMALSKLSGDEAGIVFVHLCNALEPRDAVYFSSVSHELRAATQEGWQQLRADHEAAAAWCRKMGMRSCKELRETKKVDWYNKGLTAADLALLGTLGSVLPVLEELHVYESTAGPDGVQQLAERLGSGALPAVTWVAINIKVGEAGASALAAALGRGALPRLEHLLLDNAVAAIGDTELAALAPALRRLPALEHLSLYRNPLGDEGLAALLEAPLSPTTTEGGLTKLKSLNLSFTQVTDAGCAALAAALDSGKLPALECVYLRGIPASAAAIAAVEAALATSRAVRAGPRATSPFARGRGVGMFGWISLVCACALYFRR